MLEILDSVTAVFEFAARMADFGVLSPKAAISFELHGVAGRSLTWPQDLLGDTDAVGRDCWCQEESVSAERRVTTDELRARKHDVALEIDLDSTPSLAGLNCLYSNWKRTRETVWRRRAVSLAQADHGP